MDRYIPTPEEVRESLPEEVLGHCEQCGEDTPQDRLEILHGRILCSDCFEAAPDEEVAA